MSRFTLAFLVLAAAGGCITVERDPYDSEPPRKTALVPQPWTAGAQTEWRQANGNSIQPSYLEYGTRSLPSTRSSTTTASTRNIKPSFSTADKVDEELIRAAYKSPKKKPEAGKDDDSCMVCSAAKKSASASTAKPAASTPVAEVKATTINLGVLRLINSKRVTFHYSITDAASANVSGLELWGTTDLRNWKKYEPITRTPGSLVVEVKNEGVYGFTMIARGKSEGGKDRPPQVGEPPQVWVAVDLTRPVVQLLDADLNITSQKPAVVVRWTATDDHFGPQPITLLFAERLEGPWTPLAANVENTGRYEWLTPRWLPSRVYVRVQATDLMGNVGMAQSTLLHLPERTMAARSEPDLPEPPRLRSVPMTAALDLIKPIRASNPAVSILSVDSN